MVAVNMCNRRATPYVSPIADTSLLNKRKHLTIYTKFGFSSIALHCIQILCKQNFSSCNHNKKHTSTRTRIRTHSSITQYFVIWIETWDNLIGVTVHIWPKFCEIWHRITFSDKSNRTQSHLQLQITVNECMARLKMVKLN